MSELRLRDIASALQSFRNEFGYLDVFVKDVVELARNEAVFRSVGGTTQFRASSGGTELEMQLFPDKKIARFNLADPNSARVGTALGSIAGALLGSTLDTSRQSPEGVIFGLLLGALLGHAAGAAVAGSRLPRRVLTLRYDPGDAQWKAYHGPYLGWAKEALRAE